MIICRATQSEHSWYIASVNVTVAQTNTPNSHNTAMVGSPSAINADPQMAVVFLIRNPQDVMPVAPIDLSDSVSIDFNVAAAQTHASPTQTLCECCQPARADNAAALPLNTVTTATTQLLHHVTHYSCY